VDFVALHLAVLRRYGEIALAFFTCRTQFIFHSQMLLLLPFRARAPSHEPPPPTGTVAASNNKQLPLTQQQANRQKERAAQQLIILLALSLWCDSVLIKIG
jgi:hypothetical protein